MSKLLHSVENECFSGIFVQLCTAARSIWGAVVHVGAVLQQISGKYWNGSNTYISFSIKANASCNMWKRQYWMENCWFVTRHSWKNPVPCSISYRFCMLVSENVLNGKKMLWLCIYFISYWQLFLWPPSPASSPESCVREAAHKWQQWTPPGMLAMAPSGPGHSSPSGQETVYPHWQRGVV